MRSPAFASIAVTLCLSIVVGCDDKPGARGGSGAASASTSAALQASASKDPELEHYGQLQELIKRRTLAYLVSLQKIYAGDGVDAETKAFLGYFAPDADAQKTGASIASEAAFTGKEGMGLKKFDLRDISFDDKLKACTVSIYEEQSQRGKPRCMLYELKWAEVSGTWYRTDKTGIKIIDCQS